MIWKLECGILNMEFRQMTLEAGCWRLEYKGQILMLPVEGSH